jgi:virginiamycin B lyase
MTRLKRTAAALLLGLVHVVVSVRASGTPVPTTFQDEFPEGPGKQILQTACTTCHDLDEVTKFKGFYTRAQWRDVVVTMVDYGAKLQPGEIDALADYLNQHFGKK